MNIELRELRYFLELAQTEHLTQAAQNLYVSQSTLSHSLRQLEERLGAQLFERVGRGLKLSEAGRALRGYASRALQEVESGRMALAEISGLNAGRLRIGAIPSFGYTVIPSAVAAFGARYPKVFVSVFDLRAGELLQMLREGELDVGVSLTPVTAEDVECEALFDEALVLAVHASHPLGTRRSVSLKALDGVALAMQPRRFLTRQILDAAFREAGITPLVRLEMDSVQSQAQVCREGTLATILPERAARFADGLHVIRLRAPSPVRHAAVLWRRGGAHNVAALEFVRLLRATLGA